MILGMEEEASTSCSQDWYSMKTQYLNLLESGSTRNKTKGTVLLGKLSKSAPEPILESILPFVIALLADPSNNSEALQGSAAYCLTSIAQNSDRLCVLIGQFGAIEHVMRLLIQSEEESEFRKVLARCLREIVVCSDENRDILISNDGLEDVMNLMVSSTGVTRSYFGEVLSAMAIVKEVRTLILVHSALPLLVESVSHGVLASRTRAALAVGIVGAHKRVRQPLVETGVIPALIGLLRDGDTNAKLVAGNTLGIIADNVANLRMITQAGAIPLIVELVEGTEQIGRDIAEDVLCILAFTEENAVVIAEHLLGILRGLNDSAKATAADILWDLSGYKHSTYVARDTGAIPLLLQVMQDGRIDVREKALGAVVQLSYDEANRQALVDGGIIPILLDLLSDESDELRDSAAEALMNFSEDPMFRERISDSFEIPSFQEAVDRLLRIRMIQERIGITCRGA